MTALPRLQEKIRRISRLREAIAVLDWDQQTYMPPSATEQRADQVATLSRIVHEEIISQETADLLHQAEDEAQYLDPEGEEVANIRAFRREYNRRARVPASLAEEFSRTTSLAHNEWVLAKKNNDYKSFQPWLEKIFHLCKEIAESRGYEKHPYDALLDPFEPGMQTEQIQALFDQIREPLITLVHKIQSSPIKADDKLLYRHYPIEKQRLVAEDVIQRIGFDPSRGRQDTAPHPFCTSFSTRDVRITNRFKENWLPGSLYAAMHEAGHALYEQGFPDSFNGTFLRDGASLGFHESQSRMWENWVGRSLPFVEYYFPTLQGIFPESLRDITADQFYRAVNKVEPSLIRVEADEVTYNLHIMIRFELELDLLEGKLSFHELPDAWNAKMRHYLGIEPSSPAEGVLQDVHWSAGIVGYFPTYTLGNLIAGQLWKKIITDIPDLYERIRQGDFQPLLQWLRTHVHIHGAKYLPQDLLVKITGKPLDASHYLQYLQNKFHSLYALS